MITSSLRICGFASMALSIGLLVVPHAGAHGGGHGGGGPLQVQFFGIERGTIVHESTSTALKADPKVLEEYLGVGKTRAGVLAPKAG